MRRIDCVLLDDDEAIQMLWRHEAKAQGVELAVVQTATELLDLTEQLPLDTAIYVDLFLRGEPIAPSLLLALQAAGFYNLYIETGYDPTSVPLGELHGVCGIVDKLPPWSREAPHR